MVYPLHWRLGYVPQVWKWAVTRFAKQWISKQLLLIHNVLRTPCLFILTIIGSITGWWFGTWILFFHSDGNAIIPTDELIFFRGLAQPPTRLVYISKSKLHWYANRKCSFKSTSLFLDVLKRVFLYVCLQVLDAWARACCAYRPGVPTHRSRCI